jgi:cytochrome c oxidase cbb3-type subunit 3
MSDENQEPLTDHDYDGIKEYDNPLPTWWLAVFLLTIIFSFHYYLHYEWAGGPTLQDELKDSLKELETVATKFAPATASESEEQLTNAMKDPKYEALGMATFSSKCASCHGPELGGLIGPNLTDEYWIHGKGRRTDIAKVIREGVPDKGMPPWGALLSKDEVYGAVALIVSKKNSHPANAKAPQGEKAE